MTFERKPLAQVQQEMDAAAAEAEQDLVVLRAKWNSIEGERDRAYLDSVGLVAEWWSKWFMKAGHKRLGRILVKIARENKQG